jgi:DDE superfamily endonuclease
VLTHRFNWKRMSMAAALAYRPDGTEAALVFHTHPGAYNDEVLMFFLTELHRRLDGAKITLLSDGLPSHRSRAMAALVTAERRWLVVQPLPAYAPELNPVEGLWGNVKGRELANLSAETIEETVRAAEAGLDRVGRDADLAFALAGPAFSCRLVVTLICEGL